MQITADADVDRTFSTIREMLTDRGLDVSSLDDVTNAEVVELSREKSVFHVDLLSCDVRIVYNMNPKFKTGDVKKVIEDWTKAPTAGEGSSSEGEVAAEKSNRQCVVVARDRPATNKGVDELKKAQLFNVKDLLYNVTKHTSQPSFEPVRDEAEIARVKAYYKLQRLEQLPIILSTDAVAQYLALAPGQLVRIVRKSPSAGTSVTYRCTK